MHGNQEKHHLIMHNPGTKKVRYMYLKNQAWPIFYQSKLHNQTSRIIDRVNRYNLGSFNQSKDMAAIRDVEQDHLT